MSRLTWSWRSFLQFQPTAPSICPLSYADGSTSTSMIRSPLSFPCSATHSVETKALVIVDELNSKPPNKCEFPKSKTNFEIREAVEWARLRARADGRTSYRSRPGCEPGAGQAT